MLYQNLGTGRNLGYSYTLECRDYGTRRDDDHKFFASSVGSALVSLSLLLKCTHKNNDCEKNWDLNLECKQFYYFVYEIIFMN